MAADRLLFRRKYQCKLGLIVLLLFSSTVILAQGSRKLERENTPKGDKANRTALVIGNSGYADAPLKNPVNDAGDMAAALKELGFEVLSHTNLNQNSMKRAIRDFGTKLRTKGGVGLFYYAGHGVQVRGVNYLIPVGAAVSTEEEIEYESVQAGLVLAQMEGAKNDLNIVILDACRNNPFARSYRSADKGLAQINAPSGTLIAYSTAPGSVASDGTGRNGLYTQELLKQMRITGLSIEDAFKNVRVAVRSATSEKQTPWESSSLTGAFYFSGDSTARGKPGLSQPFQAATVRMPSAIEVLENWAKTVGGDKATSIRTLVMKGTIAGETEGLKFSGTTENYIKKPGKSLSVRKFTNGAVLKEVFDGNRGWVHNAVVGTRAATIEQINFQKRNSAVGAADISQIRALYPKIVVKGTEMLETRQVHVLELVNLDNRIERMYFGTDDALLYRWDVALSTVESQKGITFQTQLYLDDYVEVNGMQMPLTLRQKGLNTTFLMKFNIADIKFNSALDDALFREPSSTAQNVARPQSTADTDKSLPTLVRREGDNNLVKRGEYVKQESMFTFELLKCVKSGSMVTCDLAITNNDRIDKKLEIPFPDTANGRTFDDQGSQSELDSWQIGSTAKREALLIPEVSVKAYVRFKGVSPQATMLKRLDLGFQTAFSEGGDYKRRDVIVRFNDIALR